MTSIGEIYEALDDWAPFETQEEFDNSGLLVGSADSAVQFALLALDLTSEVCAEAAKRGVQLVITHHPLIFDPLRRIPSQSVVYQLIQAGISVISVHTNLDKAPGGVSDTLADTLGLVEAEDVEGGDGCVKIGEFSRLFTGEMLARRVKERLELPLLRLYDAGNTIRRVALCSGAGGSFLPQVIQAGADAYITGDVKHNQVVDAANAGITLIDAGHYETESIILEPMRQFLQERFPTVEFRRAMSDRALFRYF
ncbi:MAG: Nif3-like dinuclear metal center hexameric protein [Candidatus Merdivicinus sp.]|jgi:dinuclear metal center YbgI/SA1388 family protein